MFTLYKLIRGHRRAHANTAHHLSYAHACAVLMLASTYFRRYDARPASSIQFSMDTVCVRACVRASICCPDVRCPWNVSCSARSRARDQFAQPVRLPGGTISSGTSYAHPSNDRLQPKTVRSRARHTYTSKTLVFANCWTFSRLSSVPHSAHDSTDPPTNHPHSNESANRCRRNSAVHE